MKIKYSVIVAMVGTAIFAAFASAILVDSTDAPPTTEPAATAAATTRPGVTVINLHLPQAVPEDVFQELARQGGVKFSANGNLWDQDAMQVAKDVDLSNRPFWGAVRDVCDAWGLDVQPWYGGLNEARRIMLQQSGNRMGGQNAVRKLPSYEVDGFLIEAVSFQRQQSVNYAQPDMPQDSCNVQLMVFVDPSLRVESPPNAKAVSAVDDAGNSMMIGNANRNFYGGSGNRSLIYNCNLVLKYPVKAGKKIADLKGVLQVRIAEGADSLVVDKPLQATEKKKVFGDTTVIFLSLKKNGPDSYALKLKLSNDDPSNNIWNVLQNSCQLVDDQGRAFSYGGGGGGGDQYMINFNRNGGNDDAPVGDPVKWTIELPAQTHTQRIPFEFKDLPLP